MLDAAGGGGGAGSELYAALRPLADDPGVAVLYERLDELAGARRTTPESPRWRPTSPPPYRTRSWR